MFSMERYVKINVNLSIKSIFNMCKSKSMALKSILNSLSVEYVLFHKIATVVEDSENNGKQLNIKNGATSSTKNIEIIDRMMIVLECF